MAWAGAALRLADWRDGCGTVWAGRLWDGSGGAGVSGEGRRRPPGRTGRSSRRSGLADGRLSGREQGLWHGEIDARPQTVATRDPSLSLHAGLRHRDRAASSKGSSDGRKKEYLAFPPALEPALAGSPSWRPATRGSLAPTVSPCSSWLLPQAARRSSGMRDRRRSREVVCRRGGPPKTPTERRCKSFYPPNAPLCSSVVLCVLCDRPKCRNHGRCCR